VFTDLLALQEYSLWGQFDPFHAPGKTVSTNNASICNQLAVSSHIAAPLALDPTNLGEKLVLGVSMMSQTLCSWLQVWGRKN
jgi:hypothetical protein